MKLADPTLLKDKCLVNGKWVGEGVRPIANPATGAVLAKTPRFGEDETGHAIEAAERAFGPWAKTLPSRCSGAGSTSSLRTATTSPSS